MTRGRASGPNPHLLPKVNGSLSGCLLQSSLFPVRTGSSGVENCDAVTLLCYQVTGPGLHSLPYRSA